MFYQRSLDSNNIEEVRLCESNELAYTLHVKCVADAKANKSM